MPEMFTRQTVLFVVRLWTEPAQDEARHWRGQIEHVGSGETAYFQLPEAMLALLAAHLHQGADQPPDPAPPTTNTASLPLKGDDQ